jgi:glycosyltransferase involved in cell wall biosynthesis
MSKVAPSLADLPPPPAGRTGWPWTEGPSAFTTDGPRITVVTPSYMQGCYVEETIRSVLLQGYSNLEYFVMDGGSTDETRGILLKYEPWLAGWRCERDRGQSSAINAGWEKATGEIVAWINSDDWYHPGALAAIARAAQGNPDAVWWMGCVDDTDEHGTVLKRHHPRCMSLHQMLGRHDYGFHQPGMFWRRWHILEMGLLDEKLHNSFDGDLWARSLSAGFGMQPVDAPVAFFRRHNLSKTGGNITRMLVEDRALFDRYAGRLAGPERAQAEAWLSAYEAERVPPAVYQLPAAGKRGKALRLLLAHFRLLPKYPTPMLFFGALWRILVTGKPAPWYLEKVGAKS